MRMKILILLLYAISLITLSGLAFVSPARAQEPFDRYTTFIPWNLEKAHLDDFAIYLTKHRDTIGYLVFYTGGKDSYKMVSARVEKSRMYLIDRRKIAGKRLVVIYAGRLANFSTTILQPLDTSLPPPYEDLRKKPK